MALHSSGPEPLVVIALVGILIAVLLPVVQWVRTIFPYGFAVSIVGVALISGIVSWFLFRNR